MAAWENSGDWPETYTTVEDYVERPRIRSKRRKKIDWNATRSKAAYFFLVLFEAVYFGRPMDLIPGAENFPFAKITGVLAIGGFVLSSTSNQKFKMSKEMKLFVALFIQLCMATAFSTWRGGSFNIVFMGFSKILLLVLVLVECASSIGRLRQLIYLHTGLVAVIALLSIIKHDTVGDGRVTGAVNGIFGNPNDLACAVVCVVPFALMFMISERNPAVKIGWGIALSWMAYCVFVTASRGAFMGMLVCLVAGWIYMGKSSRRIIGAAMGLGLLVAVAVGLQGGYGTRVKSILNPDLDETRSSEARQDLLFLSIELAEQYPLFGIGPGQFLEYSGNWHVAHNSYTEFAAEAGLLAAILFTWMLVHTIRKARYIALAKEADPQLRVYAGAIVASLMAFSLMIFFLSLEYQFETYIYIGYGSALGALYSASLKARQAEQENNGVTEEGVEVEGEDENAEDSEAEDAELPEETESGDGYDWEPS